MSLEVTMDNIGQLVVAIGCGIASAFFSIQRKQQDLQHGAQKVHEVVPRSEVNNSE